MKKMYFQRLFILAAVLFGNLTYLGAQSLQLLNLPGVTFGDPWDQMEVPIYVKNISGSTINVIAHREQENLAPDHVNFFCWDVCFGPPATTGAPITAAPGDTIKLFKSYLDAFGNPGVSSIRFSFYNEANMADSVQYTFVYNMNPVGLSAGAKTIGLPYPNPAHDRISIDLNLPQGYAPKVEIVNAIGKVMKVQQPVFEQGTVTFSTANLAPGVYFVRTSGAGRTLRVQKITVL